MSVTDVGSAVVEVANGLTRGVDDGKSVNNFGVTSDEVIYEIEFILGNIVSSAATVGEDWVVAERTSTELGSEDTILDEVLIFDSVKATSAINET